MTIDEFKKNIAPHMKKGWVAMDQNKKWCFYNKKPSISETSRMWLPNVEDSYVKLKTLFIIKPVDDWTKSLIEVGV